jgi:hypothetical protein
MNKYSKTRIVSVILILQVLIPPKSMQQRLRDEAKSAKAVLEQVKYRAEWLRYQEAQKAKQEEILERERGFIFLYRFVFLFKIFCYSGVRSD